jgi:hypothetical protein
VDRFQGLFTGITPDASQGRSATRSWHHSKTLVARSGSTSFAAPIVPMQERIVEPGTTDPSLPNSM